MDDDDTPLHQITQAKLMFKVRYRNFQPSRANDDAQGTILWTAEVICPVHGEIGLEDVELRPVFACAYDWQQPCCRKCNEALPGLPENEVERGIYHRNTRADGG